MVVRELFGKGGGVSVSWGGGRRGDGQVLGRLDVWVKGKRIRNHGLCCSAALVDLRAGLSAPLSGG